MRPYTIFVDLDGTIVEHNYTPLEKTDAFLPGALERLIAWHDLGHKIVITTARQLVESFEFGTEADLAAVRKLWEEA